MNKYIIIGTIIILLGSWGTTAYYKHHNDVLKNTVEIMENNEYAYQQDLLSLQDSISNVRGVYKLTIDQIKNSQDKTLKELRETQKNLKIKDKELKEMTAFAASVKTDTTINITNIINDSCEFDLQIKYNPKTIFNISNKKVNGQDSLRHSSQISAKFQGFIYEKSIWKEPKFLKRLFLFRWGKTHTERSILQSDNDKIDIEDFKIVKVKE